MKPKNVVFVRVGAYWMPTKTTTRKWMRGIQTEFCTHFQTLAKDYFVIMIDELVFLSGLQEWHKYSWADCESNQLPLLIYYYYCPTSDY